MKAICTLIVTLAALGFAVPGQAAAQSVLEQKLDKIITVLEKGQQANEARFRRIEALFPSIEARLAQLEQRGPSTPPYVPASSAGYASPKPPTSYAPGYAPPPGLTPCYTYSSAPPAFIPVPGSPLSPDEQKAITDYFARASSNGHIRPDGSIQVSPEETEALIKLMKLLSK